MATSNKKSPTFDVIRDNLKIALKASEEYIEPCGDWTRTLFLGSRAGFTLEMLEEHFTGNEESDAKLLADEVIPRLGREFDAHIAGLLVPGWFVDLADDPNRSDYLRHGGRPVAHPLRRECLNLLVVDDVRCELWLAEVTRRPRRSPKLGQWRGPGDPGGPLVDGLRRAVGAQV